MRVNWKTFIIIFSIVYIIVTLVSMYRLYSDIIVKFKSSGKFKYRKHSNLHFHFAKIQAV